ncbi:MAG: PD40 domain-containing protein [Bacteroidales bacterium]|nr:PD40 domain-containing protein [Bacteroidales bacterium]
MGDIFIDALCPYVSPDGKYIFFLRMGKGYNNVYWASSEIIDKLKSEVLKLGND